MTTRLDIIAVAGCGKSSGGAMLSEIQLEPYPNRDGRHSATKVDRHLPAFAAQILATPIGKAA